MYSSYFYRTSSVLSAVTTYDFETSLAVIVKKVLVLPQAVSHNCGICPDYDVEFILLILAAETTFAVTLLPEKKFV